MLIHRKICDRCKVEYDRYAKGEFCGKETEDFSIVIRRKSDPLCEEYDGDFCPDCVKAFGEFLKGKGHAHWVEEGDKIWCSHCGDIQDGYYSVYTDINDEHKERHALSRPNYCRNCGSIMDGEIERREE